MCTRARAGRKAGGEGRGGGGGECTGEVRQWCAQTLLRAGESPCSPGADVAEKESSHAADAAVMHTNTPEYEEAACVGARVRACVSECVCACVQACVCVHVSVSESVRE